MRTRNTRWHRCHFSQRYPIMLHRGKRCKCALFPSLCPSSPANNFQNYKNWAQLKILRRSCWFSSVLMKQNKGIRRIPGSVTNYRTWIAPGCNYWEQPPLSEHKLMFLLECPNCFWQMPLTLRWEINQQWRNNQMILINKPMVVIAPFPWRVQSVL